MSEPCWPTHPHCQAIGDDDDDPLDRSGASEGIRNNTGSGKLCLTMLMRATCEWWFFSITSIKLHTFPKSLPLFAPTNSSKGILITLVQSAAIFDCVPTLK